MNRTQLDKRASAGLENLRARHEIHRGLIEPLAVKQKRTKVERGIQAVAAKEELQSEAVSHLVSA